MRLRTLLVPFMLAAVAACGATPADAPTTGTADDEAAIRATNAAYGTEWSAKDTTAMFARMADDYTGVAPDGTYFADKAAAMAGTRTDMAAMPPGLTLTVNTSFVKFLDASHAITGGTWSVAGMPAGTPSTGSWTATTRKDSTGSWKSVNSLAATFIPPAAAMPDSAVTQ